MYVSDAIKNMKEEYGRKVSVDEGGWRMEKE